jgi:hypothetical protein
MSHEAIARICTDGGALAFVGLQSAYGAKCGDSVLFRSPRGSTLSVPLSKLCPIEIRNRIAASELEFGLCEI